MKNFEQEENYVVNIGLGSTITVTIADNIKLSALKNRTIEFVFNGVTVKVRADSNPELIFRDWLRSLHGFIDKSVGPYPNAILTDEEKASDASIKAMKDQARQKRDAEFENKAKIQRETVKSKLANAPSIELADEAGWQKFKTVNSDGYGGAVVTYSERWARLMQVEMANGKNLEDCADPTSYEADLEGITGFMYGCAVSTLSKLWKHGEQLRRWHNKTVQIGNEGEKANESGGVLNPALLSIG